MSAQLAPVLILLKQRYEQLNAGEIGGYTQEIAEALVKRGIGEPAPKVAKAKSIKVPAELLAKQEKAEARIIESRIALERAQQECFDASQAKTEADADVDNATNPRPKMVLVRLHRRFGALNGRVLDRQSGRVIREGEVGGFDEATAAMLTKTDNKGPDGNLLAPYGEIVSEGDPTVVQMPEATAPKLVLVKLRRRVGPLNAGEIGGYDPAMAAQLLADDPKLGPAGELVDAAAAITPAPPSVRLTDPGLEVLGQEPDAETQAANDKAFQETQARRR